VRYLLIRRINIEDIPITGCWCRIINHCHINNRWLTALIAVLIAGSSSHDWFDLPVMKEKNLFRENVNFKNTFSVALVTRRNPGYSRKTKEAVVKNIARQPLNNL
jgi:hypothetical protein